MEKKKVVGAVAGRWGPVGSVLLFLRQGEMAEWQLPGLLPGLLPALAARIAGGYSSTPGVRGNELLEYFKTFGVSILLSGYFKCHRGKEIENQKSTEYLPSVFVGAMVF